MSEKDAELRMVEAVTHASNLAGVLDYIRDGRSDWALELLELTLDTYVIELSRILDKLDKDDQAIVIATLRSIRDYRGRHPRKIEVNKFPRINPDSLAKARDLQEQARKILDRPDLT